MDNLKHSGQRQAGHLHAGRNQNDGNQSGAAASTAAFAQTSQSGPVIVPRDGHPISRANISQSALKVLYRLKDAGYQAFLVGGAVRDLLLGLKPKDFDIATNAHPEQVRDLFRNCRLIGRRFHLAHVRFGQEIIEVATFRASHTIADEDHSVDEGDRVLNDHGRILRDNLYGNIEEDVWRRDFTANALYYNIEDFSVWDYVGGVADTQAHIMRLIGDPDTRYREDPVRMLRAVRFAAKLQFTIHSGTAEPIARLAPMLDGIPAARLFDEVCKLFLAGSALRTFELLVEHRLFAHLFPATDKALARGNESNAPALLRAGLQGTDDRVRLDKSVTPTFLFAVLLWPAIKQWLDDHQAEQSDPQAWGLACDQVCIKQVARVAVPRRFTAPLREMMMLQPRFERREGRRALRLLEHPRFRAAYDFMLLRAAVGDLPSELGEWWTNIQTMPTEQRTQAVETRRGETNQTTDASHVPKSNRRRRRRKPPAAM